MPQVELDWSSILRLAVTAGIVTAIANQGFTALREWFQRRFAKEERRQQEESARIIRREAAHDAARDTYLPKAQELLGWSVQKEYEAHWQAVGGFVFRGGLQATTNDPAKILELAHQIATGHPSAAVRSAANDLYKAMDGFFTYIDARQGEEYPDDPELTTARDWRGKAEAVVEAIHTPPAN